MPTTLLLALAINLPGADTSTLSPDACALRIYSDSKFVGTAIYCRRPGSKSTCIITAYHNVYQSKKVELSFTKENDVLEAKSEASPRIGTGLVLNPDIANGRFGIQYSKELIKYVKADPVKPIKK